jgi:hypothetical protein
MKKKATADKAAAKKAEKEAKANGTWVAPVARPKTAPLPGDDDYVEGSDTVAGQAASLASGSVASMAGSVDGEEGSDGEESGAESEAEAAELAKSLAKAAVTDFYAVLKKWSDEGLADDDADPFGDKARTWRSRVAAMARQAKVAARKATDALGLTQAQVAPEDGDEGEEAEGGNTGEGKGGEEEDDDGEALPEAKKPLTVWGRLKGAAEATKNLVAPPKEVDPLEVARAKEKEQIGELTLAAAAPTPRVSSVFPRRRSSCPRL